MTYIVHVYLVLKLQGHKQTRSACIPRSKSMRAQLNERGTQATNTLIRASDHETLGSFST